MRRYFYLVILCITTELTSAQWISDWFPENPNVKPFAANFLEGRTGAIYLFDLDKIRLDIGTSRDLIKLTSDENTMSVGFDFFTYTRLRKQNNFKFPVETIDYMFGINYGYKVVYGKKDIGLRFRLSHISAHLVDGLYDKNSEQWIDNRKPFVYSREFFEIFPYYSYSGFRGYLGLTYIFHTVPGVFKKRIIQIGMDYFIDYLRTKNFTPFAAYDLKFSGTTKYAATHTVNTGIKFGQPESRGFSVYFSFISGRNVHGELFDISEQYLAFGFNLDI